MAKRRARGEGTIYYDAQKDRYIGAVTVGGRRRKVTGKDKTEARALLADLLAAKTTGATVADKRITVAEVVARFITRGLPNRRRNGQQLSPSTVELHYWCADLITDEIGKVRVAELDVKTIENMLDRLARRGDKRKPEPHPLSRATLTKVLRTLQLALDFAVERREATSNPARLATITPSARRSEPRRALSPIEARALLAALRTERNGAMFGLSLRLGLRPGEAAALYWTDVDLEGRTVNVTRGVQTQSDGSVRVVDDLKVDTAKRTIEMPTDMADWLAEHRVAQVAERLAATEWLDDRLVFATRNGNTIMRPNMRRALHDVCERAGVTKVSPNELRHSCASLLADMGVMNEAIADLLGHTTTRMVDQTYRHRLRPVVDVAARVDWTAAN